MEKNDKLNFHIPRWNELPDIDLYLDQVVTFIDKYLSNFIKTDIENIEDKETKKTTCITKTMINNYVKQNIMDAPIKKKYNKKHIACLFVICILKQVYTISDIDKLIKIALKDFPIERAYNTFCQALESCIENTFSKIIDLDNNTISSERYLLYNVVQTIASKLYVEKKYLN